MCTWSFCHSSFCFCCCFCCCCCCFMSCPLPMWWLIDEWCNSIKHCGMQFFVCSSTGRGAMRNATDRSESCRDCSRCESCRDRRCAGTLPLLVVTLIRFETHERRGGLDLIAVGFETPSVLLALITTAEYF